MSSTTRLLLRLLPRQLCAVVGVAVALAVLGAACGGDDDGDESRTLNTGEASTSTSTTEGEPRSYGDDAGLDALWDACAAGDDTACETLYLESPVGSDYEDFGDRCGGRSDGGGCPEDTGTDDTGTDDTGSEDTGTEDTGTDPGTDDTGTDDTGSEDTGTDPGAWAATAEAACSDAYLTAPDEPLADSGDIDDQMALFEQWHGDMVGDAVSRLEGTGPTGDQAALVEDMAGYRDLTYGISQIYAGDWVAPPDELAAQEQQREDLVQVIVASAESLGVPSCGTVVELP